MYINSLRYHNYGKDLLPIDKVIELAKVKQYLFMLAYFSTVIRQYEVSYIPTTWSITLKRSLLFP